MMKDLVKIYNKRKNSKTLEERFMSDLSISCNKIQKKYETKKATKSLKPSQLGGCMRKAVYQLLDTDINYSDLELADLQNTSISQSGIDRHIRIQNLLMNLDKFEYLDVEQYVKEHKIDDIEIIEKCGAETKCYSKKYNMKFMTDGILLDKETKELYIFEFKTEISKKWNVRKEINNTHIAQATAYSLILNIDKIIFLYENRDTCMLKFYELNVTKQYKDRILYKIDKINNSVKNKEIIHIENNKHCTGCAYKSLCIKNILIKEEV